eukprot:COSAG06_NODE_7389_length_2521_cov_62.419901_2_plen_168_part_00
MHCHSERPGGTRCICRSDCFALQLAQSRTFSGSWNCSSASLPSSQRVPHTVSAGSPRLRMAQQAVGYHNVHSYVGAQGGQVEPRRQFVSAAASLLVLGIGASSVCLSVCLTILPPRPHSPARWSPRCQRGFYATTQSRKQAGQSVSQGHRDTLASEVWMLLRASRLR